MVPVGVPMNPLRMKKYHHYHYPDAIWQVMLMCGQDINVLYYVLVQQLYNSVGMQLQKLSRYFVLCLSDAHIHSTFPVSHNSRPYQEDNQATGLHNQYRPTG